ncbi:MAG TPA: PaaI family thioesterase [Pseudonocardiaceae bacterium]|jgi:uncharacterized protein (TIGR00369 family)|nr:PaaI family thioesterase [Pseudonocardiaceae bacterium]
MDRTREYSWSDPMALAEAGRDLAGIDFLRTMLAGEQPPSPIGSTLGFNLTEVAAGRAVFTCTPSEFMYNPIGMVHGGVIATLLDSAAGCALHTTLPAGVGYTSLDLNLKYLRPVSKHSGPLRAIGTVLNKGRRTGLAQAELRDAADRLIAHATSSLMIFNG